MANRFASKFGLRKRLALYAVASAIAGPLVLHASQDTGQSDSRLTFEVTR
jgi:hypothetical protein